MFETASLIVLQRHHGTRIPGIRISWGLVDMWASRDLALSSSHLALAGIIDITYYIQLFNVSSGHLNSSPIVKQALFSLNFLPASSHFEYICPRTLDISLFPLCKVTTLGTIELLL